MVDLNGKLVASPHFRLIYQTILKLSHYGRAGSSESGLSVARIASLNARPFVGLYTTSSATVKTL